MSEWNPVGVSLPDLDVPVWIALKEGSVIQGVRCDLDGDGWGWANCYGSAYVNCKGEWACTDAEYDDDYDVTHWMELPEPPK